MAALTVPELPEVPVSGYSHQPELPAPPIGAGRNGKREREALFVDLFGLVHMPPRILDRKEAAALLEVLQALRTHPVVTWVVRLRHR